MSHKKAIILLETLAARSWSGFEEHAYDGWVMRFGGGYSNRANSVSTHASTLPLAEKVATCERAYAEKDLPAIFKLTEATQPTDLEPYLIERGYRRTNDTCVMTLPLASSLLPPACETRLETALTAGWLDAIKRMKALDDRKNDAHKRILQRISTPVVYASVRLGGTIIAGGVGVVDEGHVGIFDIVVDTVYRVRGLGKCITQSLLVWGQAQGAHTAYLQVETSNAPALHIYRQFGFQPHHAYWYRVQGG